MAAWSIRTTWGNTHDKINRPKLFCTSIRCSLQALWIPHVDVSETKHLCARSRRRNVGSDALRLLDLATDDAGICAEVDEGADLGAANCACAASAKDDFVCWLRGLAKLLTAP